ncbi:hypothetical protein GOB94_01875 [Granulicella sp. 5B5]|nr:hypothetical protein GOB94_01875 [Granulicella sp. 5B5]
MLAGFTDDDFKRAILRALRLTGIITAIALPVVWWKLGWRSAALLLVGSAISASGLWEWLRLMSAVIERMDVAEGQARPMGRVLIGFFLRLGLTILALYVSLKTLDGSVYALAAGLALGIFALTVEALRLVKAWTV